jgi:hypothetical protein
VLLTRYTAWRKSRAEAQEKALRHAFNAQVEKDALRTPYEEFLVPYDPDFTDRAAVMAEIEATVRRHPAGKGRVSRVLKTSPLNPTDDLMAVADAIREDVTRHVRTDPACVQYRTPRPGSRLDRASRGYGCPACIGGAR